MRGTQILIHTGERGVSHVRNLQSAHARLQIEGDRLTIKHQRLRAAMKQPKRHNFPQTRRCVNYGPCRYLSYRPLSFRRKFNNPYELGQGQCHHDLEQLWIELRFPVPNKAAQGRTRRNEVTNDRFVLWGEPQLPHQA